MRTLKTHSKRVLLFPFMLMKLLVIQTKKRQLDLYWPMVKVMWVLVQLEDDDLIELFTEYETTA